jgi:hypothetical protein
MLKSANKPLRRNELSHMTELVMDYIPITFSCISRSYSENSSFHAYRLQAMSKLLSHLCKLETITLLTSWAGEFRCSGVYWCINFMLLGYITHTS